MPFVFGYSCVVNKWLLLKPTTQSERDFAKSNAKKFAQHYKDQTGQTIDEARAEQILLGDGYRMVDASANQGPGVVGPAGDAVARSFLAQYAGGLFKASADEYNNPGNLHGPLAPEQKALPGAVGNPVLGLGAAVVITGGLGAPALLAIPGTPIFGTGGALGSGMWASPVGTAAISAGINAGSQYLQNSTVNSVDVSIAAMTGGVGTYGGVLWNIGVNAAGGAGGTAINNYLNKENNSVLGSTFASGVLAGFGYGVGKLGESTFNLVTRPTVNTSTWAAINVWSSGGWNLLRPNASAVIVGTTAGGAGQEVTKAAIQNLPNLKGEK